MVLGLARNRVRNYPDGTIEGLAWREVANPVLRSLSID